MTMYTRVGQKCSQPHEKIKKAVFTIASKNYLSRALTLADSVSDTNSDIDVFIFLADEKDEKLPEINFPVIEFKEFEPERCVDMAFKYDILEFNTAIKPFCFNYLFNKMSYDKVIYFDPDISVYGDLHVIYDLLQDKSIVITPHFLEAQEHYKGPKIDRDWLFVGIYNLGFTAIKNNKFGREIVAWWMDRLENQCFVDAANNLHVDQKWMDFVPSLWMDECCISTHLGLNAAGWNVHERTIFSENGHWSLRSRKDSTKCNELIFYHFSGFDPHMDECLHKRIPGCTLARYPEYKPLFEEYRKRLLAHDYDGYMKLNYRYNTFSDGTAIRPYQRRMYRSIRANEPTFELGNPFVADKSGKFFSLLDRGNCLPKVKYQWSHSRKKDFTKLRKQDCLLRKGMQFLHKVLGADRYFALMGYLVNMGRAEMQTFLLPGVKPPDNWGYKC